VRPPATPEAVAATVTETIPRLQRTQRRRWRRWVAAIVGVCVLAAAAYGAWTYLIPHTHAIPDVVGVDVGQATAQLGDLGFTVVQAEGHHDPNVPAGAVLTVDPPVGTELKEGSTITLVPSLGPPPVAVPDVTGTTVDAATEALQTAGLERGNVTQVYSDTVDAGHVVRQNPPDGKAPQGSAVDLWVSKGHAPAAIPAVVGKSQDRAERMLRSAGFVPVVQVAFSDQIARGLVIKVDPAEGTSTPYGDPVTITVSQGPEEFPAPNFTGMTKTQAEAKADEVGLQLAFIYLPGTSGTIVIAQSPVAGTTVRNGDTVTLYMS
jgi:eukaryotic-like serine/threonine-protein kinase